jgi:hypothetical protein
MINSTYVPRPPSRGISMSDVLMLLMQQQQAQQGQAQAKPSLGGLSNLLSGAAGGSAASGGAAAGAAGAAGAESAGTFGGLAASTPVASSIEGGTILADGSVAGAETAGLGSVALPAGVALATALGGRTLLRTLQGKGKNWKDASLADNAGRLALATSTMGMSEVANWAGNKLFGKHKSTGQRQRGKLSELVNAGYLPADMPGVSEGIMQDQGITDDAGLKTGKYKAKDVWGVSGMYDTFGKDWLGKFNEGQREQISQAMLDNKLLDSKKGLVRIVDQDKARTIAEGILNGNNTMGSTNPVADALATLSKWQGSNASPTRGTPLQIKPGSMAQISNLLRPMNLQTKPSNPLLSVPTSRGTAQVDAGTAKRWREQAQNRIPRR